jgi:hypothetical protein
MRMRRTGDPARTRKPGRTPLSSLGLHEVEAWPAPGKKPAAHPRWSVRTKSRYNSAMEFVSFLRSKGVDTRPIEGAAKFRNGKTNASRLLALTKEAMGPWI